MSLCCSATVKRRATIAGKETIDLPENTPDLIREHGMKGAARILGNISAPGLRHRAEKNGWPTSKESSAFTNGVTFTIDKRPPKGGWTPEALLEAHGLDPSEWWVADVRAVGNQWGNPEEPNEQVKLAVTAKPVRTGAVIQPPDLSDWKPLPKPKPRKVKGNEAKTTFVIGDHHAPRHDRTFHKLFVQLLRDDQPDSIEINGDLMDLPSVSRHRTEDSYNHAANECLNAALHILRDYRDACPNATITLKRGNHDNRLYYYSKDNAPEIEGIAPGGGEAFDGTEDKRPWHNLERLLYLDLLHIDYVDEDWAQAETDVNDRLSTVHGHTTTKNPGAKILADFTGSTLQNHTHRISVFYKTSHNSDGPETRMAGECGCACELNSAGLGYHRNPDWQQGAMMVRHWSDQDYVNAPIIYLPGRLLLPDGRRFTA